MYAVDFFCGAGGLTRGFLNAGVRVVAGIDANHDCKRTYESNNRPSVFIHADLKKIDTANLAKYIEHIPREELIFVGCAPCQPFSKQRRDVVRDGNNLLEHFGWLVEKFKPGYVVIENVPGIAKVPGNSTYKRFIRRLETLSYKFDQGRVDAKRFGVPQSRVRWVVIASRLIKPTLPKPTHGPRLIPYSTVRKAIRHYPSLSAGEISVAVPNHRAAQISPRNLRRLQATPHNGGSRCDWPDDLILKCHRGKYTGHSDVYGRMKWDSPAPTLTCKCCSISNGRYGHPEQNRAISLREAASLQSFPKKYVFYGSSQGAIAAQIGNAVPVKLAEVLARCIIQLRRKTGADANQRFRRIASAN